MNQVQQKLLFQIAGMTDQPEGAYNIRVNGSSVGYQSTENITVALKENGQGLSVTVKPGTTGETVYIPVLIETSGHQEQVLNEFFIGAHSDVRIIAGCGMHNDGHHDSRHDGLHSFILEEGAKVVYEEKHYGEGNEKSGRIFNPETRIELGKNSDMEIETIQMEGVSSTKRTTVATVLEGATLVIKEKIMTDGHQTAETVFEVHLNGEGASANVISRAVAKDTSQQIFLSKVNGNAGCYGHSECDAIIMDHASVRAIPEINANHTGATLIHEAAIGKIAGEQITKLMTLGLTGEEAEQHIVKGFLK